jgi:hypothetical protein
MQSEKSELSVKGIRLASDKILGGFIMPQGPGNTGKQETEKRVIDFGEVRAQKLEEKRRTTQRIFFKHLLNVYSVVGDSTLCPIEFIDVSEEGCSFQIPYNPEKPWPTSVSEIPLRIYFSQDTYLEIHREQQSLCPLRLQGRQDHGFVRGVRSVRQVPQALRRTRPQRSGRRFDLLSLISITCR